MPTSREACGLWAVTSYFNPAGYRRRLMNYRRFRERLCLPLLTVELSFDGIFALNPGDAERLVHLRGGDVLWQKERLLNIGLPSLPELCRQVVCLDCDVIFTDADWPQLLRDQLERVPIVQCFRTLAHLSREDEGAANAVRRAVSTQPSLAARVSSGASPAQCLTPIPGRQQHCALGSAIAFRRELLERHGLYDACIIGGGDLALMAAAYGCFELPPSLHAMTSRQRDHYLAWARPFHQSVCGAVGSLDADLLHLWHGSLAHRGYRQRHVDLGRFDFDPYTDMKPDESTGLWRWNSDKPDMHQFVRTYFASRREDDGDIDTDADGSARRLRTDDLSSFGAAAHFHRQA